MPKLLVLAAAVAALTGPASASTCTDLACIDVKEICLIQTQPPQLCVGGGRS